MTNEEKIKYINNVSNNNPYSGPISLYKYRPFDQYTFDMLENNYLFLCPAEKLDDPTECIATIDINNLYDLKNNGLKKECTFQIVELVREHTTEDNYEIIKSIMSEIINSKGLVSPNFLLDVAPDLKEYMPEELVVPLINYLTSIPRSLDEPVIQSQIKFLILGALEARQKKGICSLCDNSNDEYMWKNYADKNSGYCVEYDFVDFKMPNILFPVIYEDERETNIAMAIIANYVNQMIFHLSNGEINADTSQYLRLFITKNKKWEYQNEWRLLGDANTRFPAPKIKRIILGTNVSLENKKAIAKYCAETSIPLEELVK